MDTRRSLMEKPKWPIGSLIRESDLGPFCPKCYSSFKYKFWPFKSKYCIQPECENYWKAPRKTFTIETGNKSKEEVDELIKKLKKEMKKK